jgi:transporter family-2 protein
MASLISFLTGTLTLMFLALIVDHRLGFSPSALHTLPGWVWFGGGTLGVIYLTSNLLLLPKLGAALTVVSTLCGQMIMAICIDQFGWFGVAVQSFSLTRFIGVLCLLGGVLLMQKF